MEARILEVVEKLEADLDIRVLLACETGSRAWGFASPDSDYDIRLLYCHPVEWYLSVNEPKDELSSMEDDNLLDITGWELRKTLRLLNKSNMAVFERLDSSIVYRQDEQFCDRLRSVAKDFYNPLAAIHHYLGIARNAHDDLNSPDGNYSLKRLFYGLRTAAACQWIYEDHDGPPPIVFDKILDEISLTDSARSRIRELVEIKSGQAEKVNHSGEVELLELIGHQINVATESAASLSPPKPDRTQLNQVMRDATLGTTE